MGENLELPADMIRLTFIVDPVCRDEVEAHLNDLGLDVIANEEGRISATWDEPDRPVEALIEELWAIHGSEFEATLEEFRRIGLHTLHHEDDGDSQSSNAA